MAKNRLCPCPCICLLFFTVKFFISHWFYICISWHLFDLNTKRIF